MAGGYHQHDLQFNERVGMSFDWLGENLAGMSLSYSSSFRHQELPSESARAQPMTLRVTLRGWELFEADTDGDNADFFSFDRIRERDIRQQTVMISVSKHF